MYEEQIDWASGSIEFIIQNQDRKSHCHLDILRMNENQGGWFELQGKEIETWFQVLSLRSDRYLKERKICWMYEV